MTTAHTYTTNTECVLWSPGATTTIYAHVLRLAKPSYRSAYAPQQWDAHVQLEKSLYSIEDPAQPKIN